MDEDVSKTTSLAGAWTRQGVEEAVKQILAENNTLFQSLTKNLNALPEMKEAIRSILMEGTKLAWNPDQNEIVQMQMYGLIRDDNNMVRVSNRIFEMRLYNLFLSDEEMKRLARPKVQQRRRKPDYGISGSFRADDRLHAQLQFQPEQDMRGAARERRGQGAV